MGNVNGLQAAAARSGCTGWCPVPCPRLDDRRSTGGSAARRRSKSARKFAVEYSDLFPQVTCLIARGSPCPRAFVQVCALGRARAALGARSVALRAALSGALVA